MYNPSVCEIGDYAILAMEQLVLNKMADPVDDFMPLHIQPRDHKQVWVSFFWKPVYRQSCTKLKSYAGFIYFELSDLYATRIIIIFMFVLFQNNVIFCLVIYFLMQMTRRCLINVCARFFHHDECWGFTASGEWLSFHFL